MHETMHHLFAAISRDEHMGLAPTPSVPAQDKEPAPSQQACLFASLPKVNLLYGLEESLSIFKSARNTHRAQKRGNQQKGSFKNQLYVY